MGPALLKVAAGPPLTPVADGALPPRFDVPALRSKLPPPFRKSVIKKFKERVSELHNKYYMSGQASDTTLNASVTYHGYYLGSDLASFENF